MLRMGFDKVSDIASKIPNQVDRVMFEYKKSRARRLGVQAFLVRRSIHHDAAPHIVPISFRGKNAHRDD